MAHITGRHLQSHVNVNCILIKMYKIKIIEKNNLFIHVKRNKKQFHLLEKNTKQNSLKLINFLHSTLTNKQTYNQKQKKTLYICRSILMIKVGLPYD